MTTDPSAVSVERDPVRLYSTGPVIRNVGPNQMSPRFSMALGTIFILIGIGLGCLAFFLPGDPRPRAVFRLMMSGWAALFLSLGVLFIVWGARARMWKREQARLVARNPHEPAFVDYPWDPAGAADTTGAAGLGWLLMALFMAMFLMYFHVALAASTAPNVAKGLCWALIAVFDFIAAGSLTSTSVRIVWVPRG